MDAILKPICKFLNFLYKLFLLFACGVLLAIVLIICAQVVARQVLQTSIRWSQEVAQLLMVWMAFITCAVGVRDDKHIAIEMFYQKFPAPIRKLLFYVNWLLIIVVGVFFTVFGYMQTASTTTSLLPSTGWPKCVMYMIIPVSGFFIIYISLLKMFKRDDLMPDRLFFEHQEKNLEGGENG